MSYEILEAVRAALVAHLDTELDVIQSALPVGERNKIGENVFPSKVQAATRLTKEQVAGQEALLALAFYMKSDAEGFCGKTDGVVVIDVASKEDNKKVLWEVSRAVKAAVHCRRLQAEADLQTLGIRASLFKQLTAEDQGFDTETQVYILHSEWQAKYVKLELA